MATLEAPSPVRPSRIKGAFARLRTLRFPKQPWVRWAVGGLVLLAIVAAAVTSSQKKEAVDIMVRPTEGAFVVAVTATGELQAKNSVKIYGPANARQQRIYEMKIMQLVPEGTVVKAGEFVAELDRSELTSKVKDAELEVEKELSAYEQAMLDTLMTLSKAREDQINQRYALEEVRLRKEQAIYEAPSIQRQAEIDYEKADRAYKQLLINYKTQVQQAEAQMRERSAELAKDRKVLDELNGISGEFTIMAPENGMVVYRRDWRGQRVTQGGTVSAWDPVVAELPDLTSMESITYINEVDIQKIKVGQPVEIGLDADPKKRLTGTVVRVANIGEQRPNSDAKVFEVVVSVDRPDATLRPAMTTSNTIIVSEVPKALHIPLEAIHAKDSLNFVYVKEGARPVRQEIRLGLLNENNAIVEEGLTADAQVFLSVPVDTAGIPFHRLPEEREAVAERRR